MIVIYCNDYFFTVDLALHRLSFWRGPVKPTINETFSETEVVTRGLYENQQGSNRQRNKKQATERKKKANNENCFGSSHMVYDILSQRMATTPSQSAVYPSHSTLA